MSHISVFSSLYNLLTDSTDLMDKITGVFDVVPGDIESPYVVLGQLQSLEGRLQNYTERSWSVDIHIWSSYRGSKEVLQISDIIFRIIPDEMFVEELQIMEDPSDWYHGVLTIRGYDR